MENDGAAQAEVVGTEAELETRPAAWLLLLALSGFAVGSMLAKLTNALGF